MAIDSTIPYSQPFLFVGRSLFFVSLFLCMCVLHLDLRENNRDEQTKSIRRYNYITIVVANGHLS